MRRAASFASVQNSTASTPPPQTVTSPTPPPPYAARRRARGGAALTPADTNVSRHALHDSAVELIGNTPLVRLNRVTEGLAATVLAKVEYFNPGGSVKDRIAVRMIDAAEQSGELRPGGTIVEPTSGNTGIGLAIVAQQRGYQCIFVCPDKVSGDKIDTLRAYGAEVVVCPTAVAPEDPRSYYAVSDRLARETPGGWKPDQYANPNNPLSHYETTGPEIWRADRGPDHPLRGRRRHRRHHHRHRPLPEGAGPGPHRRRRPGGLGVLGRHRPALPGRGRGRGLLAAHLSTATSPTRSSPSPTRTPSR